MYTQNPLYGRYRRMKGSGASGHTVGLMHIEAAFPVVPGNPVNASTFDFPVLYQLVASLTGHEVINGDPSGEAKLVEAALALEKAGVSAIVGACGSFAGFQQALRESVSIPVFSSILVQVPLILHTLPMSKSLGIIFADKRSFTERIIQQCRISDPSRIRTMDCRDNADFRGIMGGAAEFDEQSFLIFFRERIESFLAENTDVGAIMIQCNELIPYAWVIQCLRDIPVFDVSSLLRWVHGALSLRPPAGFVFGMERIIPG